MALEVERIAETGKTVSAREVGLKTNQKKPKGDREERMNVRGGGWVVRTRADFMCVCVCVVG